MIVINCRFLTQPTTGVQRFAEQIVASLTRERDDLVLVAPQGELRATSIGGVPVTRVGRASGHRWEQLDLPRYLRQHGSPLLVSLTSTAPIRYRNQISTHHDVTYVRHPESFSRQFRALYSFLAPRFLKNSRAVVTVSEFSRGELSAHYHLDPDTITVVGNAVDDRFRPGDSRDTDEAPYFLAVSSPNLHKNFGRMIEAYGQYADETNSDLVVIGEAPAAVFGARAPGAPGTDRVRFLGRVDDDELIRLYQNARAFIFPSLYEGFGIPPLEAQKCATPVIAARAAAMPEVLADSVVYFDPLSTDEIREAIRSIDRSAELRADLVQRGLANVQRFSWESSARTLSGLITRVTA
ncbi:glycosyltransferase family 1 protein [Klugiella xanthotipulae]|uniref:Glycosyltransferase involved in cell wall biosynthesis n=1 Tax=Klugiella xanthotipulae TaxID=244735 RepID=A0A543HYZ7_9MICO|nr:glycosyltransferase family 1 protein [Klugiella xanthotipulae]TQM63500.1 glycosyltransferase involved in cell wall biosynthesis [Klugiella xanthotipulae]